jgi:hypothetical protein
MNTAEATALLVLGVGAAGAQAAEPDQAPFSFSAFGTLGLVHSSEDLADFTAGPSRMRGAGFSRSPSAEVDSLVAAPSAKRKKRRWPPAGRTSAMSMSTTQSSGSMDQRG